MSEILVVDDDANTREALAGSLKKIGHQVFLAGAGAEALELVRQQPVELAIIDLKLPDMEGTDLFEAMRIIRPYTIAIMISARATVDEAVSALKLGIYDFITKDFRMQEIRKVVNKALETQQLLQENQKLRQALQERLASGRIIGRSQAFLKIIHQVNKIAPLRSTVLLTGESGVGKELIAEAIHYGSPRRDKPLVKVNCGALPEGLIESELFGHEKGAFTGAHQQRKGRFELADGGTIFLDEVAEMPLSTQVKLLRVLQEGEFERVGGARTLKVDVRLVAATNQNLEDMVAAGVFRKDLFYRLNVIHLEVPPLRARDEDIPLLAQHFLDKFCLENERPPMGFSPEALKALKNYLWPGNVRELENVVERAVALCTGSTVGLDDLPDEVRQQSQTEDHIVVQVGASMEEIERLAIRQTLKKTGGDKEVAARILGIGLATLYRRLKEMEHKEVTVEES
ncbi:sigma-54-dependent transcriptional regulator [Desulfobacca acetoxidans]|uniref:Two component, sigma54 specific, transcriptional regulator, Fis family n=1 Tax=Desulfobacca acetoxidans (strain ATCC 700848 / DSM 11109 / ASRB2) TaxID=880072 RepID=F2NGI7_DESAR|nr:sigma-54 dependent transcriptional regulator [Desulfobacca acetoxidans]AEB08600.1 two component, sigma54 specific, transcriptional regulator, Fis family [Desulfobacca acetoxidans DSM 11109]